MMSLYRPDRRQPGDLGLSSRALRPFKLALLERSLALFEIVPDRVVRLRTLTRLAPRKQAQDLRVVCGRIDVVRTARRRQGGEKLRVAVEDLAGACIARQGIDLLPHLDSAHH